jgi:hypothetical protein
MNLFICSTVIAVLVISRLHAGGFPGPRKNMGLLVFRFSVSRSANIVYSLGKALKRNKTNHTRAPFCSCPDLPTAPLPLLLHPHQVTAAAGGSDCGYSNSRATWSCKNRRSASLLHNNLEALAVILLREYAFTNISNYTGSVNVVRLKHKVPLKLWDECSSAPSL